MKYVVEYRNESYNDNWFDDADFDNLPDAIEFASKESTDNPKMEHRIMQVYDVEQVMFFPSIEEHQ